MDIEIGERFNVIGMDKELRIEKVDDERITLGWYIKGDWVDSYVMSFENFQMNAGALERIG